MIAPLPPSPYAEAAPREVGRVKCLYHARGFGFITPENGRADLFVHYSNVRGGRLKTLAEGQRVDYCVEITEHGPRAVDVVVIEG